MERRNVKQQFYPHNPLHITISSSDLRTPSKKLSSNRLGACFAVQVHFLISCMHGLAKPPALTPRRRHRAVAGRRTAGDGAPPPSRGRRAVAAPPHGRRAVAAPQHGRPAAAAYSWAYRGARCTATEYTAAYCATAVGGGGTAVCGGGGGGGAAACAVKKGVYLRQAKSADVVCM